MLAIVSELQINDKKIHIKLNFSVVLGCVSVYAVDSRWQAKVYSHQILPKCYETTGNGQIIK